MKMKIIVALCILGEFCSVKPTVDHVQHDLPKAGPYFSHQSRSGATSTRAGASLPGPALFGLALLVDHLASSSSLSWSVRNARVYVLTHYSPHIALSDVRLATETLETRRSRPVHLELAEHQGWFSESRREQAADETRELEEQVPGAHTFVQVYGLCC